MNEDEVDEIVQEFLVESAENLDQLDRDLVALEQNPTSRELLGSIFRAIHTIKGTTGFLGFSRLEKLAHAAENLLSRLRDGHLILDAPRTTALLEAVDEIRGLLALIESKGSDEDDRDLSALMGRLQALQDPNAVVPDHAAPVGPEPSLPAADPPAAATTSSSPEGATDGAVTGEAPTAHPTAPPPAAPPPAAAAPVAAAPVAAADPPVHEPVADAVVVAETPPSRAEPVEAPVVVAETPPSRPDPAGDPLPGGPAQEDAAAKEAPAAREGALAAGDRTIRVDVELLDALMRQTGELVLARNQIVSLADSMGDSTLSRTVQRLSLIVSELQEGLMKTRMQPVDHLWSKVPRLVRDLSSQFAKQVNVVLEGGETELDRSIIEAVKDPLTHLVRNAVDHGIEAPAQREAKGKPGVGTLVLRAHHEGGHVILEMIDDGAGVDPSRVAAKALEKGLVTADELDRMSERDVCDLIFRAGFSTAETVTNVSGRGVGMDVVRTNIERIGGTADLQSEPGVGTTFRIKVPLTLAIIPALLVGCQGDRYAIPQAAVQELVRLEGDAARTGIERIDEVMMYRLRGRLLPLVRLDQSLGLDVDPLHERSAVDIVVVKPDQTAIGLVVDSVHETQEIVVKPLSQRLRQLSVFAGATILGDGAVSLILDLSGVADTAGVRDSTTSSALTRDGLSDAGNSRSLLVLKVGDTRRVAVALSQVVRLEEVEPGQIEFAGSRRVLQYRNELLPVVWLTDLLGVPSSMGGPDERLHVIVCSDGTRAVGLVAEDILDVVEAAETVHDLGRSMGRSGTVVVQGQAADLLDVPTVLAQEGVSMVHDDHLRNAIEEMSASAV